MAICLPGIASRVKRADTSAILPAPFVMTMVDYHQYDENDDANRVIPADQIMPECLNHLPRRVGAGMAFHEAQSGSRRH